jgi:hypothetical protein
MHCAHTQPGAYLTMRYVGINQGTGEYRDAIPFLEGVPTTPTGQVGMYVYRTLTIIMVLLSQCSSANRGEARHVVIH